LSCNKRNIRRARKAQLFWEARETLSLALVVCIASMVWLPWATGRPTITILELSTLMWTVRALLKPGQPPLL
jgi:hypothetical protein